MDDNLVLTKFCILKSQGVANRGASVRVGRDTEKQGKGKNAFVFRDQCQHLVVMYIMNSDRGYKFQGILRTDGQRRTWIPILWLRWLRRPPFSPSREESILLQCSWEEIKARNQAPSLPPSVSVSVSLVRACVRACTFASSFRLIGCYLNDCAIVDLSS